MAGGRHAEGFDGAAAVTRSLLGYGVLAGVFYLTVGVALALTREGFVLSQHALSLLTLGDQGWMQRANFVVTGAMTAAVAGGYSRALAPSSAARKVGTLLGVYAAALIASAIFLPDPMGGFPPGATDSASTSGILHLVAGAIGFVALTATALIIARWFVARGAHQSAWWSYAAAAIIVAGFLAGGALATSSAGVAALWLAVLTGWVWLGAASIAVYKTVPHPDADKRAAAS